MPPPLRHADLRHELEHVRDQVGAQPSARTQAILRNYALQLALQATGSHQELVDLGLTNEYPRYEDFRTGGVIDGRLAIANHFKALNDEGGACFVPRHKRFAVAEWGLVAERQDHAFVTAKVAQRRAAPDVLGPGEYFIESCWLTVSAWYDDLGRLSQMRYYPEANSTFTRIEREQYLSAREAAAELHDLVGQLRADCLAVLA